MNESVGACTEVNAKYENQPNNNFIITFEKEQYKIDFIKDRGLLELKIYNKENLVSNSKEIFDSILKQIPNQNPEWPLSICVELIDYYIEFLKHYFKENKIF